MAFGRLVTKLAGDGRGSGGRNEWLSWEGWVATLAGTGTTYSIMVGVVSWVDTLS